MVRPPGVRSAGSGRESYRQNAHSAGGLSHTLNAVRSPVTPYQGKREKDHELLRTRAGRTEMSAHRGHWLRIGALHPKADSP